MTSSTSGFSIRTSLVTFLALWLSYQGLLLGFPWVKATAAPRSTNWNRLSLERKLDQELEKAVVLGSSLTADLLFPSTWTNLAVIGSGPRTGLEVLKRLGHQPQVVLVEVNMLLLPADTPTIEATLNRGWLELPYRERPSRVLVSAAKRLERDMTPFGKEPEAPADLQFPFDPKRIAADPKTTAGADFQNALALQRRYLAPAHPTWNTQRAIERLKSLEEKGTRLVFFVVPEEPELANVAYRTTFQAELRKAFPAPRYQWLEPALDFVYATSDGRHMLYDARQHYNQWLLGQLAEALR